MRYAFVACAFGFALAVGFALLVILGGPFEPVQVDLGDVVFQAWVNTLHSLRPVVIDLVHQLVRGSL